MSGRTDVMDATDVLAWARGGVEALGAARSALDRVNVVPVADADTGTNLYLTFLDATRSLGAPGTSSASAAAGEAHAGDLLVRLARGALVGARGNSGVILSEYLRGLAVALAPHRTVTGTALAAALAAAARTARGAVAVPLPGTILTAADDAARAAAHAATPRATHAAALRAAHDPDPQAAAGELVGPAVVARAAHDGARAAALRSSTELDVLARARVLDAGALGLTLLLGALRVALGGSASRLSGDLRGRGDGGSGTVGGPVHDVVSEVLDMMSGTAPVRGADEERGAEGAAPGEGGELEVMYVVEATRQVLSPPSAGTSPVDVAGRLRAALGRIGDSVVVVGGRTVGDPAPGPGPDDARGTRGLWQAHVHTDDPVAAVAAGREVLRAFPPGGASLRQVRVRHLAGTGHHGEPVPSVPPASVDASPDAAPAGPRVVREGRVGLVAVTTAPGLVADLARAGAVVLLREPGSPVDAASLRRLVVDTGAPHVALLPGTDLDDGVVAAARAAVRADGVERLDVLDAPTDLHVVVALAAAQLVDHGATQVGTGLDAARRATVSVRVAVVDTSGEASDGDLPGLDDALGEVLAGPTEIVTVLADDDVAQPVLDALVARVSAGGAETVVLRSGRPGGTVTIGAEPPGGVGHDEGGATG
ncbi:DAK2 domain-containing protein [Cellulosimicrobium sp. PMB13]|uniref:DAK2 domain-containing protein n=1 Tax=Cellulosimicrobium sp. PMB13 TaxID=3120158 RepID=UPI003F4BEC6E